MIITLVRPTAEVGIYGAAYRPIEYALLASTLLISAMFPLLARSWNRDHDEFRRVYRRGGEVLLMFALPVPAIALLAGRQLVSAVYAPGFAAAAAPLLVLALALVLMVVNAWQAFCLLAGGRQRVALGYDAAAVVLNVGLNLLLVPRLGYMGAACVAGATSIQITLCAGIAVRRLLGVALDKLRVLRLVAANAGCATVLWALLAVALPWWAAIFIAYTTYPAWLLGLRLTSRAEVLRLLPARPAAALATNS